MTTTDGDRAMRRLIASSVLIAGASLASGCGLLEEGVEPKAKPALGSLETLEGKGFRVKLPCIPARSRDRVPVDGGRPLTMQTWICDGGDVRGHALDIVPADDRAQPHDLHGAGRAGGRRHHKAAQALRAGARLAVVHLRPPPHDDKKRTWTRSVRTCQERRPSQVHTAKCPTP